jgi:hypothetical protein
MGNMEELSGRKGWEEEEFRIAERLASSSSASLYPGRTREGGGGAF